jgi:hypothetical protein
MGVNLAFCIRGRTQTLGILEEGNVKNFMDHRGKKYQVDGENCI